MRNSISNIKALLSQLSSRLTENKAKMENAFNDILDHWNSFVT